MLTFVREIPIQLRRLRKLPLVLRFAGGAFLVLATFALLLQFPAARPESAYIVFLPVILLTGLLFDHGTTVFATVLSAALSLYYLINPVGSFTLPHPGDAVGLAIFIGTALAAGGIIELMRHAVEELAKANIALSAAVNSVAVQGQLLDTILEGTPDLIYVKDMEGKFVHLNMAAARVLGVADAAAARGHRDRDFIESGQADAIETTDAIVLSSGKVQSVEEEVTSPELGKRVYLSTKAPWFDAEGSIHGLIGVSRDVTERIAGIAALRAADAQKQLLLFDINHRVKNHLQSIVGLLSLAAARITDVDGARIALHKAATRLVVLGKVYTKLQLGVGSNSEVEAREFIEDLCADLVASIVDAEKISISVNVENDLIDSDKAVTLGLIINELVQNALKYAFPEGRSGKVSICLERHHTRHILTVGDDGIGLKKHNHDSGSGQLLVRALVSQLDGDIKISSPPGASFRVTIPSLSGNTES